MYKNSARTEIRAFLKGAGAGASKPIKREPKAVKPP